MCVYLHLYIYGYRKHRLHPSCTGLHQDTNYLDLNMQLLKCWVLTLPCFFSVTVCMTEYTDRKKTDGNIFPHMAERQQQNTGACCTVPVFSQLFLKQSRASVLVHVWQELFRHWPHWLCLWLKIIIYYRMCKHFGFAYEWSQHVGFQQREQ